MTGQHRFDSSIQTSTLKLFLAALYTHLLLIQVRDVIGITENFSMNLNSFTGK